MTRIAGVAVAMPPHRYPQHEITRAFTDVVLKDPGNRPVLERVHAAAGVRSRHLALPMEEYAGLDGFTAANTAFIDVGTRLAQRATSDALARAGLTAPDVDLITSATVTGVAAPSLDAALVGRLGLRVDVKRNPIFGLGCVAGAAGIARVHDYLIGHPDDVAVLVAVELCSLTLQRDDESMANLVASALFGDGAAAVVLVGERRARELGMRDAPAVVATRSRFYLGTERVMGWDIGSGGFKIVLAASVAEIVEAHLGDDVRGFLGDHGMKPGDVAGWVSHPGGPKVLDAVQAALGLEDDALAVTWWSLAEVGNLSSVSVLDVLERTLSSRRPPPGRPGMLMAMGPGFCSELVLLRW